jgi:SWI/SNF-related matrix-associated actin-dependent regulator 1 of chromatin subfamily A
MLTPYPFQLDGARWLAPRRHALLGDKMGLGKTNQAIIGAEAAGARKIAVVCPAIGRANWPKELDLWSIYGLDLKVQSYDMLTRYPELRAEWAAWKPDVLIPDEGHYLKDRESARTKMIYGDYCRNNGLASHAGATWVLSGTMAPNNISELYPHLRAMFPDVLPGKGSYADFINEYTYWDTGPHGTVKIHSNRTDNVKRLRMLLQPHLLRRTPEQVLPELPTVQYGEFPIDEADALAELRQMERTVEVQELLSRLDDLELVPDSDPHIASFRKACGLAKARPLAEMVAEELRAGEYHKIVIFAYHREVLARMFEVLQPFNPRMIMGGMGDKRVLEAYTSFQDKPNVRVILGQINACSTTITLTAAHQVLFAEQSWVPSDNEQAIYRLRRIGQKSQINARIAFLVRSIDEAINRSISRKVKDLLQLFGV